MGGNVSFSSHADLIPAANAAAQRGGGVGARATAGSGGCVTKATAAALTAQTRGGVPFAERPTGFIKQQKGGGAALHTGEGGGRGGRAAPGAQCHSGRLLF